MIGKRDKKKDLEILGLSGIFQGIGDNKRSGFLYVQSGNQEKYISFLNGEINLVASPNRPSILAEAIRRAFGQIDDETVEAVFQAQRETGKALSSILFEMNADKEFIEGLCRFQMGEEIFEIFIWPDIQFEFSEELAIENLFPKDLLELNIKIHSGMILMEAARRLDEWKSISEVFSSWKDIPYICKDIYENQLVPEEFHLLSLCDGGRDFEEIMTVCRLPQFYAMRFLHSMYKDHGYIALRNAQELRQMAHFEEYKENVFKCIKLYERAEELDSSDIQSITWLAEAYKSCGLINKAVIKYKELGEACLEKEDFEGSIKAYSHVIAYSPEDLDAHDSYTKVLFQNGQFQEGAKACIIYARKLSVEDKVKAIGILEDAYQHNPLSPEVLEYMATLYYELGQKDDAGFTYTTLANLYKSQGRFEETIQSYQKILLLNEKNIEARIELANTYLQIGQKDEGLMEYKKLGDILRSSGLLEDSFGCRYLISVCEKIIEFEPENLAAREWLADVYLLQRDEERAKILLLNLLDHLQNTNKPENLVSVLRKLVQLEPENRFFHRNLAEAYAKMQYYEEATEEYICVASLAIQQACLSMEEGDEKAAADAFSESLEVLNIVLINEPFNLEIRQKRAEILDHLGHVQSAVEEYKLVVNMTKAINNYHDALTALFHIIELAPDYEPSAFLELAKLCERQNKSELAINFYKKYARRSLMRGDLGEVLLTCRKILSLVPDDQDTALWRKIAAEVMKN